MVLKTAEKLDENGRIDQSVTGKDYAWTYVLNDKKEQEFARIYVYRVPLCGDDRCCAGKRNFFTGGNLFTLM